MTLMQNLKSLSGYWGVLAWGQDPSSNRYKQMRAANAQRTL